MYVIKNVAFIGIDTPTVFGILQSQSKNMSNSGCQYIRDDNFDPYSDFGYVSTPTGQMGQTSKTKLKELVKQVEWVSRVGKCSEYPMWLTHFKTIYYPKHPFWPEPFQNYTFDPLSNPTSLTCSNSNPPIFPPLQHIQIEQCKCILGWWLIQEPFKLLKSCSSNDASKKHIHEQKKMIFSSRSCFQSRDCNIPLYFRHFH